MTIEAVVQARAALEKAQAAVLQAEVQERPSLEEAEVLALAVLNQALQQAWDDLYPKEEDDEESDDEESDDGEGIQV